MGLHHVCHCNSVEATSQINECCVVKLSQCGLTTEVVIQNSDHKRQVLLYAFLHLENNVNAFANENTQCELTIRAIHAERLRTQNFPVMFYVAKYE